MYVEVVGFAKGTKYSNRIVLMWDRRKNMYKIRVFDRVFCPDPHRPFGDFWKSPRAARRALGDYQNPLEAPMDQGQNPFQKSEFSIQIPQISNYKSDFYQLTDVTLQNPKKSPT